MITPLHTKTALPMRLGDHGRIRDVYDVINEGRALTEDQLGARTGMHGHQVGPILFALVNMRAVGYFTLAGRHYYVPARLARWWKEIESL